MNRAISSKLSFIVSVFLLSFSASAQSLTPISPDKARTLLEDLKTDSSLQAVVASTPSIYSYPNTKGQESVNYLGQTFRQVLLADLLTIAYGPTWGEFAGDEKQALQGADSVFRYQRDKRYRSSYAINGNSEHGITAVGAQGTALEILEKNYYSDIYPGSTSLNAKLSGVDNPLDQSYSLGWTADAIAGVTIDADGDGTKSPEEFVDGLMRAAAMNAASNTSEGFEALNGDLEPQPILKAAITPEGLDLAQILQIYLNGAVSLSQATGDYLAIQLGDGKGLLADNTKPSSSDGVDRPFTALEHHWDEAYGYFGLARDVSAYSLDQIAEGLSLDTFVLDGEAAKDPSGANPLVYKGLDGGDGKVALIAEKNFGVAIDAALRDSGSQGNTNFVMNLDRYFREGRQLISQKPEGYLKYVQAYSVLIAEEWQKVMAASAIHSLNLLQEDYQNYGTEAFVFEDFAKNFSMMKAYTMALPFAANIAFDFELYQELQKRLGDAPVVPSAESIESKVSSYTQSLDEARDLLAELYGFTQDNGFTKDVLKGW